MNERFAESMRKEKVAHDTRVVADFIRIYCDSHHKSRTRLSVSTDAAELGVYRKAPVLCEECADHLAYAEARRAFCSKDPKPYCAHCDSQCYRSDELRWQGQMMRFSGPRSWYQGHLFDGLRHAAEGRKYRKHMKTQSQA